MPKTDLAQQAKAIQGRKQRQPQATRARVAVQEPTPERTAMNASRRAGMATRFDPVIDTLKAQGKLTDEQHAKLSYYKQQAETAMRSPTRDSCDFSVRGGNGNGPSMAILSAMSETCRLEAEMGPHRDVVRKVVAEDQTIRQWCLERFGGKECGGRMRPNNERGNRAAVIKALKVVANRMKINRN